MVLYGVEKDPLHGSHKLITLEWKAKGSSVACTVSTNLVNCLADRAPVSGFLIMEAHRPKRSVG